MRNLVNNLMFYKILNRLIIVLLAYKEEKNFFVP